MGDTHLSSRSLVTGTPSPKIMLAMSTAMWAGRVFIMIIFWVVGAARPWRPVPGTAVVKVRSWADEGVVLRSEEHTSELQSRQYLVCRLLLEKKKKLHLLHFSYLIFFYYV